MDRIDDWDGLQVFFNDHPKTVPAPPAKPAQ
jgi:hypothetical protein